MRAGLRRREACALLFAVAAVRAVAAPAAPMSPAPPAPPGIPSAYQPMVIQPTRGSDRVEFDLGPALARAQREKRRLYVYLGAHDCPYCRHYENFLRRNAAELVPHFKPWIVVDLRSALTTTQQQLFFRVGDRSLVYSDFQRAIGDERARMLVYPSVWLFSPELTPLMPMPAGTGTFETVEEQLEILNLVH